MKKAKTVSATKTTKTTEIQLASRPKVCWEDWVNTVEGSPEPDSQVWHDNCYVSWLRIPNTFIEKNPDKWEISMKYKEETVNISGDSSHIACGNMGAEKNAAFDLLVKTLEYDENGSTCIQPAPADKCPEKKLKVRTLGENDDCIFLEVDNGDGKKISYSFDFKNYFDKIQAFMNVCKPEDICHSISKGGKK